MLPELRTPRLLLRPVAPVDLPVISRLIGDFEVSKMLSLVPHPYTLEDAEDWYGQTSAAMVEGERAFGIFPNEGGTAAGPVGVVSAGMPGEVPDFGYWLGRAFWGRGLMTEAGRAVLAWLFETTATASVNSGALVENPASLNVLRKLGFENETPYRFQVKARGLELPGTRVSLSRENFRAAGEAVA